MPAHITHVALFVADARRTVEFYERFAGLHVVHDRVDGGVRVVWLSEQEHDPEFVIVAITAAPGQLGVTPPPGACDSENVAPQSRSATARHSDPTGSGRAGPLARGPASLAHFGYDLPSRAAVDELAARADADGVLVYAPTDAGPIVGYFCMLRDPDGNLVEFSHGQPINPRLIK